MKFLVDTQLPPRLSLYLIDEGHDSTHTTDYDKGHLLSDPDIRKLAKKEGRVVVTKDSDFSDLYFLRGSPPKVLLLNTGNIGNIDLIKIFDAQLTQIVQAFEEGSNFIVMSREEVFRY